MGTQNVSHLRLGDKYICPRKYASYELGTVNFQLLVSTLKKVTMQKYIEINWLQDINIIQCTA